MDADRIRKRVWYCLASAREAYESSKEAFDAGRVYGLKEALAMVDELAFEDTKGQAHGVHG